MFVKYPGPKLIGSIIIVGGGICRIEISRYLMLQLAKFIIFED
jgi:hypothetical protein